MGKSGVGNQILSAIIGFASIALVGAVLFPIVAQVKTSHKSPCLSNVKQLSTASLLYQADNDALSPSFWWKDPLFPYIKNEGVFRCPSSKDAGYGMNAYLVGKPIPEKGESTIAFAETPAPGHDIVIAQIAPISVDRHEGRLSISFADGHAKSIGAKQAATLSCRPELPKAK